VARNDAVCNTHSAEVTVFMDLSDSCLARWQVSEHAVYEELITALLEHEQASSDALLVVSLPLWFVGAAEDRD